LTMILKTDYMSASLKINKIDDKHSNNKSSSLQGLNNYGKGR
jgi:hypothetical protein